MTDNPLNRTRIAFVDAATEITRKTGASQRSNEAPFSPGVYAMKVLVVGDLHGDWGKLNALITKKMPDIVLCCGDFGWWPKMEVSKPVLYGQQKKWLLKGLKPGKAKIYWCDGNHEEHPILPQDGQIHEMYEGVFFCSRGSKLTLPDSRTVLFAGGAASVDKDARTPGHDWFPEETIKE